MAPTLHRIWASRQCPPDRWEVFSWFRRWATSTGERTHARLQTKPASGLSQLNLMLMVNTQRQKGRHCKWKIVNCDCPLIIFPPRTSQPSASFVWTWCHGWGLLRPSVMHRQQGRPAPFHLVVLPRVRHHIRPRNSHNSHRSAGKHASDTLRGSQTPRKLHLQSFKPSRSQKRDCPVESKW